MNDRTETDATMPPRRHSRLGRAGRFTVLSVLLVGLGAAAGGIIGASASATGGGPLGHRGGWFSSSQHQHDFGERALDRIAWVVGFVDASDEQVAEIRDIVSAALTDLRPLAQTHRDNRRAFLTELARPVVDRDAIESLRLAEVALLDEGSARAVDALGEVAGVLTPEQRARLAGHATRMRH